MQFYGMSFREIMDMPQNWFFLLYKKINTVEARRLIRLLDVSAYPHVDERGRQNIHRRFMIESGYAQIQKEKESADQHNMAWDILRGLGKKA